MKRHLKNLFLLVMLLVVTIQAQDNETNGMVEDHPALNKRIIEESEDEYSFLLPQVFPRIKMNFLDPIKNTATGSIRLRKLFGKGFTSLKEASRIIITQAHWIQMKNNRKFLVVLFAAIPSEKQGQQRPTFSALAVFRYTKMKVPEMSVFSATKWKWDHFFELVDAVDPRRDAEIEFPTTLAAIKNQRGDQTIWLLNSHRKENASFQQYDVVELSDGRLRPFFKDLPGLYNNSDCAHRFEQKLEIIPQSSQPKSPPYEIRVTSKVWLKNDCQARETLGNLREIDTYQARWQIISNKRQIVSFQFAGTQVEKIGEAKPLNQTGVPECDDFMEKYEICYRKNIPRQPREWTETILSQWRDTFVKAFGKKSPEELAVGCRQLKESVRENTPWFRCDW